MEDFFSSPPSTQETSDLQRLSFVHTSCFHCGTHIPFGSCRCWRSHEASWKVWIYSGGPQVVSAPKAQDQADEKSKLESDCGKSGVS